VGRFFGLVVLQPFKQMSAYAQAIQIAFFESPVKFFVGWEPITVSLLRQSDLEVGKGLFVAYPIGQRGENLPISSGLISTDCPTHDIAFDYRNCCKKLRIAKRSRSFVVVE